MRLAAVALLAVPLVAASARATTSGGSGGGSGVRRDWPCAGCRASIPPKALDGAAPVVLALHGDGDPPDPLFSALRAATDRAGALLVAPPCPPERGCTRRSFWRWLESDAYDDGWLDGILDAVGASYDVDLDRVHALGYSGGASFLGWYAPAHADTFAAIAYVAGGAPFADACPARKLPVYFLIGAGDPMRRSSVEPLRDFFAACGGHETVWDVERGITHVGMVEALRAGEADKVVSWMLAHRRTDRSAADDAAP